MRAKFACTSEFDAWAVASRAEAAANRALLRSGELLRARAAALAPRRSGNLAASGRVEAGDGRAVVRFTAPYAAIQHECADFRHPNGGRAGYLRAAAESPATVQALAAELARELGAGL